MINISLGYYKNLKDGSKIQIPYWFTRDNSIFLNKANSTQEVDETKLSKELLIEIHNGVTSRDLQTDDFDTILEAIKTATSVATVHQKYTQEPLNTAEELEKKKAAEALAVLKEKVDKLLSNSFNAMKKEVGIAELNDDKSLKEGIADTVLLEAAIKQESDRGDDARSSIIGLIEKRIRAIGKSSGFMRVDEEDIEIEVTVVK